MPRKSHGLFKGDSCIKSHEMLDDLKLLHNVKVTYMQACAIVDTICEHMAIPSPKVKFNSNLSYKYMGVYRFNQKLIEIYYYGENVNVLLHELAHHITNVANVPVRHNLPFYNVFSYLVNLYKKYLA